MPKSDGERELFREWPWYVLNSYMRMSVVPFRVYVQHLKDESCCQLKVMISQVMGNMKYHPFSTRWQEGFCFYIVDGKLPNIIQILYVDKSRSSLLEAEVIKRNSGAGCG